MNVDSNNVGKDGEGSFVCMKERKQETKREGGQSII